MKARITIIHKDGVPYTFENEIFNANNGVAFFEIDKEWKLIDVRPYVCTVGDLKLFEGDKVLVQGTNKVGKYETEIIRERQGWTLKENYTMLNDNTCFIKIIELL